MRIELPLLSSSSGGSLPVRPSHASSYTNANTTNEIWLRWILRKFLEHLEQWGTTYNHAILMIFF